MLHWFKVLLFFVGLLQVGNSWSQCINTYPYFDDFEAGPGIWTTGGPNSSWEYGNPTKPSINAAASGQNCWNAGGLTGSSYNNSEHSFIVSSCLDFSSLNYPFISFKIFWEVEKRFDGGNLQSSIDGGTTWVNVGAFGDAVDCNTDNWFNYNPITYLGSPAWIAVRHGWSGNMQATSGNCQGGDGSGGWVLAKHCLAGLANQPSVLLRFTFGSGTTCNSYDGIGIDDITIADGPANQPDFTFTCASNSFSFTAINPCAGTQAWAWNFGDPNSGANNTAVSATTSHTFTSPGSYQVSATLTGGGCNPPGTITKTIKVMDAGLVSIADVSCAGANDGSVEVEGTQGFAPYNYSWPNGVNTALNTGLSSGNYTALVTDSAGCSISVLVTINEPSPLQVAITPSGGGCGGTVGSALATVSGGTAPYQYAWNTSPIQTGANATNLAAGNYSLVVTDNQNCTLTQTTSITASSTLGLVVSPSVIICAGKDTSVWATASGGTAPYSYLWSPIGLVGDTISFTATMDTLLTVTATDATGCTSAPQTLSVSVSVATPPSFTANILAGCAPLCVLFTNTSVGSSNCQWTFGDGTTSPRCDSVQHCFSGIGQFDITLNHTDAAGCEASTTLPALITTTPSPRAEFSYSPSEITEVGQPLEFTNTSTGGTSWLWRMVPSTSTSSQENPIFSFPAVDDCVEVWLYVADSSGCSDSTSQQICLTQPFAFYIPNAFTPNKDRKNNVFIPKGTGLAEDGFEMMIFDRWGTQVFRSKSMDMGWDGTFRDTQLPLEMGVYAYSIRLREAYTLRIRNYWGKVVLVR